MLINYERQRSPEMALNIAEATFNKLNLQAHFHAYGKEIKTYHCKLLDNQTKNIFYGCGKGLGIQSKVSACFEALEHYAVHAYCQKQSQLSEQYYGLDDPLIVKKLKSFNILDPKIYQHQDNIPFTLCTEVTTGENLYYPLFLLDPRYSKHPAPIDPFDYKPYVWNACDSGIASGTSMEEASLHALNESIERDAYSLFLIKAFLLNQKIRIIAKHSVPNYLQKIITYIEKQYAEELILVDITSDIGVPTIFVSMTKQSMAIQPMGCGTSLNKAYALERALLESLQPLHIYNEHLAKNQKQILENFSGTPLLAKCAKADVTHLSHNYHPIDFHSLPTYNVTTTVKLQLNTIIQRIRSKSFAIYSIEIANIDSDFHCVKYIIPEFEQFYLVEIGKFILPNKRGMALIAKKQALC